MALANFGGFYPGSFAKMPQDFAERGMERLCANWGDPTTIRAKAALGHVPERAGLYKLTFRLWGTTYVYIGEAGNLRRRINEYAHNPTKGNAEEHFMFDLLTKAGEAEVCFCCLGMESKSNRVAFETTKIAEARQQGLACLNRGGAPLDIRIRRFRLESEEQMLVKELERVHSKLKRLLGTPSN